MASWQGDDLVLHVRVQPRASRDEIVGIRDARLRIRTTATPADGVANKTVIRILADYLDVPPSRITLTHGQTQRNKRFVVRGPLALPSPLRIAMRATNGL